jgi:hypothetical protein
MAQHTLAQMIAERVSAGLARKSVTSCSRWAQTYRMMGEPFAGPWRFEHHPWLKGMHDSNAELNVGQKAAQMGYSETVLNRTFYTLDILKQDTLYVLPSQTPDASDFSAGRFGPALELSPHLRMLFGDVSNVGHKRAGASNLYIRGSRSRSQLKSVPVGFLVLDELDEFTIENVPMAFERMSGQRNKAAWVISTPTLENYGINEYFSKSTQNHFHFPCPRCSRLIELRWPDSIVITGEDFDDPRLKDTHLVCTECKGVLPHEAKPEWLAGGIWVESFPGRAEKGWFITQLYSCTVTPETIARTYIRSLTDKAAEMEFFNQKLGIPHAVEGAKLTDDDISSCVEGYAKGTLAPQTGLVTLGVDVGAWLHYSIDEWVLPGYSSGIDLNIYAQCRNLAFGKVRNFEDLDELMQRWGVRYAVVDAQPERRKAIEFCNRFYGRARVCFYGNGVNGRTLMVNEAESSVTVDRTTWLDLSLGRVRRGKPWLILPSDVDGEFRSHMKALVRDYRNDQWGNPVGRYLKADRDHDHYAHARNYSEIALPLAASLGGSTDLIQQVV